jgi:SAM-dependent methyltransferase
MIDPTRRFSDKVEEYINYRPSYPPQIIELLTRECGLVPSSVIADIGSGTGLLSLVFLHHGNVVYGVEPNAAMREAGAALMRGFPLFHSIAGSAEGSCLENKSIDFVVAGQAFHWFDRERSRNEFLRILRPGGWVILIWNERRLDTPFLQDYERLLLTYGTDYTTVNHTNISSSDLAEFYRSPTFREYSFPNVQRLDLEGLKGRLLSSSYIPTADDDSFHPMMEELAAVFQRHCDDAVVPILYHTRVYCGQLFSRR